MPRLLIADGAELWRHIEDSALRRDEVSITFARDRSEILNRIRMEQFDAVLVPETLDCGRALEDNLRKTPVLRWLPEKSDFSSRLGLPARAVRRRHACWWVESRTPHRFRVRTRDASPAGLFLSDAPALPVGTKVEAVLRRERHGESADALLEVVRTDSPPAGSYRLDGLAARLKPKTAADAARGARWLAEAPPEHP